MVTYKGKNVTVVRDARTSDVGYKANVDNQVFVRYEDGSTVTVPRKDLVEDVYSESAAGLPREDIITFLQRIGQKLKNAQTANHPTTVTEVTDEINAYVAKEGYNVPAKKRVR